MRKLKMKTIIKEMGKKYRLSVFTKKKRQDSLDRFRARWATVQEIESTKSVFKS